MNTPQPAANSDQPADHVYYLTEDYAGLARRFGSLVVDLGVLFLLITGVEEAVFALDLVPIDFDGNPPSWYYGCLAALAGLYLTVLKRSPIRTPGYWIAGLRIVDLRACTPSMPRMIFRLSLWILGPINPVLDFLFISNNEERQTIRDKLAGTYVVLSTARPAGVGLKTLERISFMGMMLMYPVIRPVSDGNAPR